MTTAALAALLIVPAHALAAPPPTLEAVGFGGTTWPYGDNVGYFCDDSNNGEFAGYGPTGGSYPGHGIGRARFTLGPYDPERFANTVESGSGDFSIDSDRGYVTGVTWVGTPGADAGFCQLVDVHYAYRAIITAPDGGIWTDAGTSTLFVSAQRLSPPIYDLGLGFDSSQSSTERVLFGNHIRPGSFLPLTADTKSVSPFTLFMPATVRKILIYLDGKGATTGSQTLRAVLYRRGQNGGPGAYVTRSFEYTVPAGMTERWVPFWLAPIPKLDPGVYWIGLQTSGDDRVARVGWRTRPSSRRFTTDAFADGASDPFGASGGDDRQLAAFAAGSYP